MHQKRMPLPVAALAFAVALCNPRWVAFAQCASSSWTKQYGSVFKQELSETNVVASVLRNTCCARRCSVCCRRSIQATRLELLQIFVFDGMRVASDHQRVQRWPKVHV